MADVKMKEISAEYAGKIKRRFAENGGKLIVCDDSKAATVSALCALLKENTDSLLLIAEDGKRAREFEDILSPVLGAFRVVDDFNAVSELVRASGGAEKGNEAAVRLRKNAPRLIIAAKDGTGETLLHRALWEDTGKNGTYYFNNTEGRAPYCVSDLLAACGYGFVVMDDVYGLMSFAARGQGGAYPDPTVWDRLDFFGTEYYADTAHSYKRLHAIAGSAKQCVLLSDCVVPQDAVYLYAALALLHDGFSLYRAREFVRGISQNYIESCEFAYTDVFNCKNDEGIVGECLRLTRGVAKKAPVDVTAMETYIGRRLEYMSEEEISLRALYTYAEERFGGDCRSSEELFGSLESSPEEMARCFKTMFFGGKVKNELEGVISTVHVGEMNAEELAALAKIFEKFGVCHSEPLSADRCRVLRILREGSGFEYVVRGHGAYEGLCFSVAGDETPVLSRCLATARLLAGKEKKLSLEAPALLVAPASELDSVEKLMREYLPEYTYSRDFRALAAGGRTVVLSDPADFAKTALLPCAKSVVVFGFYPDLLLMSRLAHRALDLSGSRAVVLADYADFGGLLADEWENALLAEGAVTVPFGVTELSMKQGAYVDYAVLAEELATVYSRLEGAASGGQKGGYKEAAEQFNRMLTDFTLQVAVPRSRIEEHYGYLEELSSALQDVFGNAVSVGGQGEMFESRKNRDGGYDPRLFFNVCARMLFRRCDTKKYDCADCPHYSTLKRNDFAVFERRTGEFFEQSAEYARKAAEKQLLEQEKMKINSTDADADGSAAAREARIGANAAKAQAALTRLKRANAKENGMCDLPFEDVVAVLDAVSETYAEAMSAYYGQVMQIFYAANGKLTAARQAAAEGTALLHR